MVEPTRTRLRSRARSSMGTATRFSTATNAKPADDGRPPGSRAWPRDVQPQSLPLLSARMSGVRVSATSTLPAIVDRARPVRVAGLGHLAAVISHADHARRRRRSRTAPASRSRRPGHHRAAGRPRRRRLPPHPRARPRAAAPRRWLATVSRLSPQARIVAPGRALDDAPGDDRPARVGECDQHARQRRRAAARAGRSACRPKTSPSEPEVTMTAAPTSE